MKTSLTSTRRRMCSHSGHQERPATHVRTVRGRIPGSKASTYLAFYPECSECAARKSLPKQYGTTETLRAL